MAVSKTMRFSILKRDGFTCRYCNTKDAELSVDHVLPVSLGGTDDPTNLVAACVDCNQGKGSTPLDAENVADIDNDALRWAAAMKVAQDQKETEVDRNNAVFADFYRLWMDLTPKYAHDRALPNDWTTSIEGFLRDGMSEKLLHEAAYIAFARDRITDSARFRYFCGVVRNMLRELEETARTLLTEGDDDGT